MKFSIGTKIACGFASALAALFVISLISYRNINDLNDAARLVTHTVTVLQRLESLSGSLMQAQGAARGYVLAPSAPFQTTFETAALDINQEFGALRTFTADSPREQERLDKLQPAVALRLNELQKLMGLNAPAPLDKQTRISIIVQEGQQKSDEIHDLAAQMENEERSLLATRQNASAKASSWTMATVTYGTVLAFFVVGGIGLLITRSILGSLQILREGAAKLGGGDYDYRVMVRSRDEIGELATAFNQMGEQVQQRQLILAEQEWLKSSLTKFSALFQGQRDSTIVCQTILTELAALIEARHSVIYVPAGREIADGLKLQAGYACQNPPPHLKPGENLAGQCFLEKKRILLPEIPSDYLKIGSALGDARPTTIVIQPALFEGHVKAVLELASFQPFTTIQLAFLNQLAESIGIVLSTIEAGMRTEELLKQSQLLSASLQTKTDRLLESEILLQQQQEELKVSNEELEQTNEELRQTTEEIEEKANLLTDQKREMEHANQELEQARATLESKARQLALTSKYKSEFLANMSHELRTPLNSLLILAKMLEENRENNLSDKQVQYAKTIHSSGGDLLDLINDILDLSKIESGTVDLQPDNMRFKDFSQFVQNTFHHVAETKKLDFQIQLDLQLPATMNTDVRRLQQVIKNLISNAFKFTEKGAVGLQVRPVRSGWDSQCETLNHAGGVIAFAVTDTGIGIPSDKQQLIFEAFQQADAGTALKFGGTGLGLSISREITRLLGGSLKVESELHQGSTFTLYLPVTLSEPGVRNLLQQRTGPAAEARVTLPPYSGAEGRIMAAHHLTDTTVEDDRANLKAGDLVLLIVEDDRNFASVLVDYARDKRFKAVVAHTAAHGILLASQIKPTAIMLDIRLPDNDGWMVLDWLKHDPKTRHIPVHIVTVDEERERSLRLGAVSFIQKPVSKAALDEALTQTIDFINRPVKKLLIVEDVSVQRQNLVDLIGNGDVVTTAVATGAEALAALANNHFDCIVLDLGLPDMSGTQLIEAIQKECGLRAPPIIVYTSKELTREEETQLRRVSESIVIKDVRSPERLLDETALFLHRVQSKLPESKRRMIEQVHRTDSVLSQRKVLVVDDDVRNIFAITSALESYQMQVIYAENGQAGIDMLKSHPDVEIVLMDVMMPGMDGFEAISRIRQIDQFKKLPIISVTAKAMKDDREKCLQVGASDYITKPVDMDQLRSLLRVWLYK
jgi:CheY-like chemotaxis protein/signal transduction histidine kinase/CHASE3 domain sensor protein